MKDGHSYTQQYSELIEIEEEKYLCQSLYSGESEEAFLIMHQPLEKLLESQELVLQKQVLQE